MIENYEKIKIGKAKDLTGSKFGHLTPLYRTINIGNKTAWVCQCDCGTITAITADSLVNKGTQSCGCFQKEQTSRSNIKDLTGMVFGRLTVIQRVKKNTTSSDRHSQWLCRCSCGAETLVMSNNLTRGHTQSCGCLQNEQSSQYHTKDLTGLKYGLLTVLNLSHKDASGNNYWNCLCECGNYSEVRASHLISGEVKSCGCLKQSYGETIISQLLNESHHSFVIEKTFDDCKNPKTNHHLRFDFYVDNKYLIEFDGIQHFKNRDNYYFESLEDIQTRDLLKNEWCVRHNIPLIRIPYTHLSKITIKDLEIETSDFIYNKGE